MTIAPFEANEFHRSDLEDECSAVYDEVFARRDDQNFYRWSAETYGGPILEVGCGTGRVLVPTALAGFPILGIDPNSSRIRTCRERLIEAKIDPELAQADVGDIRTFRSDRRFRLATSPFRSLQHLLTPDDQRKALECVYEHLVPGGHFIIDVFNPSIPMLADDTLRSDFSEGRVVELADGRTVELFSRIVDRDYVRQLQHAEEIYKFTSPDGSVTHVALPFTTRYTFRYEFEHLAGIVGFEIAEVFGGYNRSPFGTVYPGEILMVLRRPV